MEMGGDEMTAPALADPPDTDERPSAAWLLGYAVRALREHELDEHRKAERALIRYLLDKVGTDQEGTVETTEIARSENISPQSVQIAVGTLVDSGRLISHDDFRLSVNEPD